MSTRPTPEFDPQDDTADPAEVFSASAETRRGAARPTGKLDERRCSVRARIRGESPVGTAAPALRWVLIEQAGPWGRNALTQSKFDPAVAPRLAQRARAEGVRLLLVRRPDARAGESQGRWAYVDGRAATRGVWWSTRTADAEIADSPWDGAVGERSDGPTYLVCSHGGHDACCALRGRPLARGLQEQGADVWECSHLGGDRFSPNVLVLPLGFYYGQVTGDGAELIAAHAAGEVTLPFLRGRAGLAPAVQAAQDEARHYLDRHGVEDLPPRAATRLTPLGADIELWAVTLVDGGSEGGSEGGSDVVVVVQGRPSRKRYELTCSATHEAHFRVWESVSISTSRRIAGDERPTVLSG